MKKKIAFNCENQIAFNGQISYSPTSSSIHYYFSPSLLCYKNFGEYRTFTFLTGTKAHPLESKTKSHLGTGQGIVTYSAKLHLRKRPSCLQQCKIGSD